MSAPALYAVVALCGAAVLVLEILGTRILGPFYGVSLYLWSALISVTLAALSVGYALGGRWADRRPDAAFLGRLILIAGLWTAAIPWLRGPLLAATEGWGLRAAVLVTALVLFGPPLTLLGMVSPFAIRLRLGRIEEAGRTAGHLFAVSTVASVAGALATGFWLIPTLGVTRLTLGTGALLLLASGIASMSGRGARVAASGPGASDDARTAADETHTRASGGALRALVPFVLAAFAAGGAAFASEPRGAGVVERAESAYSDLRVVDLNGRRQLLVDGGIHTQIDSVTRQPWLTYVIASGLLTEVYPRGSSLLLVGLGGGSAAREFARGGWTVDAVEIDPVVTGIARRHFGLQPEDATVHHADGRRFFARSPRKWNVIFLDAFGSSSIPFHLVTREAFEECRAHLEPGGALMLNVESIGWHGPLVRSLGATLHAVFPEVVVFPLAEPPDQLGNLVMVATDRPIDIPYERLGSPRASIDDDYEHWRAVTRNHAWDNRFGPEPNWGPVLTDDLNPSDLWAEETNLEARRQLHQQLRRAASW